MPMRKCRQENKEPWRHFFFYQLAVIIRLKMTKEGLKGCQNLTCVMKNDF